MDVIQAAPNASAPDAGRRITALDGLRGVATIMVVLSHYFGELEHGLRGAMVGWIAVDIFFVLSGFLIGKLILDRRHHKNFFTVFYARRFFRIIPPYVLTVVLLVVLIGVLPRSWTDSSVRLPLWSYLTFTQGFFMVSTQTIGAHWLAPTWTLGVEEHFYLLAPASIVFAPRKWLTPALIAVGAAAVGFRMAIYFGGLGNYMMPSVLLPGRADLLVCGLLAAVALKNPNIRWPRHLPWMRWAPAVALVLTSALHLISDAVFQVFSPLLLGAGCAAFMLRIVLGAPEAQRFESRTLRFFGDNGYCIYLTHLPILGLMHGLILGGRPDIATPAQWLVTFASLPVAIVVGWAMTRFIEEPLTRYGRTFRWSPSARPARTAPAATFVT